MVTNVTSLTGNGLRDWLIQRVSAVYFAAYMVFILAFLLIHSPFSYTEWHTWAQSSWFKVASLLALVAFSLHAWIGIWTVTTDYIKCTVLRLTVQLLVAGWLSAQFIWGFMIFWGL
ncbi:succinate dehydrogenase, hydrophobic membrane anchor protein [Legionella quinlivanii]|uniref:Succinate dehydrogenase hydrophobic membrane anchor subunit n=1 Tax=Legionella quinlivanii TaxID=45073 RepID=A0A0W0Y6A5_9GAMM|nr:succinate dehydrogenase, hydrophobic membrane anchor protein [Legionella quinlivanii]KTD52164.1 succinate dehydrogenase, hydrophobic membrane anchor protein [Legionella quinlivanii]MCW8452428.1 succinate dehydrogenase, hydrophobic membrane anchor protein [Legionella quinlivanii]SEF76934.1 succinate dehydrogenase / fumarate reductase membrane anchor subunit [Legionella quinlivanii DSM 21216]STY12337.1 succinate dehydrogenase, hydrophobic membrane anchor protein [Legionella quinlivanii]